MVTLAVEVGAEVGEFNGVGSGVLAGTPQYGSNKTKGQKRDKEADKMAY